MLSFGPGPPSHEARFPTRSQEASHDASLYMNNFEEEFSVLQDVTIYGHPSATTQLAARSSHHHETNPFESSFSPNMSSNPTMMRSASLGNMTHSPPSALRCRPVDGTAGFRLTQSMQGNTSPKRPRTVILTGDFNSGDSHCPSSNTSSFTTAVSTDTDPSDVASRESNGSENGSNPLTRQHSAQYSNQAPHDGPGAPISYENVARLNFERLAQGYAQNNNQAFHQPAPKPLPHGAIYPHQQSFPLPSYVQPVAQPLSPHKIYSPLPVRPESNLLASQIHNIQMSPPSQPLTIPAPAPASSKSSPKSRKSTLPKRKILHEEDQLEDFQINDESKRVQFLERNRLAACRSREKKKHWIKNLESTCDDVMTQNQHMANVIKLLQEEIAIVKGIVGVHPNCSCGGVQKLQQHLVEAAAARSAQAASVCAEKSQEPASKRRKPSMSDDLLLPSHQDEFQLPQGVLDTPTLARTAAFSAAVV